MLKQVDLLFRSNKGGYTLIAQRSRGLLQDLRVCFWVILAPCALANSGLSTSALSKRGDAA